MSHWGWVVAAVTLPAMAATQCESGSTDSNIKVENQRWAQRAPKGPRDMVNWLTLIDQSGVQLGAAQRRSAFRWIGEGFWWVRKGNDITMRFPQTDRRLTMTVKPYACKKGVFDRCLDVTWRGRTVTLYSNKDLVIEGSESLGPLLPVMMGTPADTDCTTCTDGAPESLLSLFDE